ncbi:MAG: threonylcarbamoyl-AMP synthase [Lachnospiraceae bacterium]|nr:threonylcarbamoyl-AMP synthase [Lachnospiraceae bacterium]MEE1256201.1 L-threonylcarbamoyladenylate synthase [Lachnospiraceae bacterium]
MKTKLIRVDAQELHDGKNESREALREAGEIIRQGGLVAFPTETVYGLGGDALNPESSKKIYAAKGRPSDNPLIIHIADIKDLEKIVKEIPQSAYQLADVFWPGPLTMILPKSEEVPYQTTGGLNTVAVRMPSHPVALEFIREAGGYVAAPSANLSGKPSPTKAKYVVQDMDGRIDMIIDGDGVDIGLESTIVDLTGDKPMILRPGYITKEMLDAVLGQVETDPTLLDSDSKEAPKAPGMRYRHYAPKGELVLVEGSPEAVVSYINEQTSLHRQQGEKTGIIGTTEMTGRYEADSVKIAGSRDDETAIARQLYTFLREFDDEDVAYMYAESFAGTGMRQAIMNRLLKAAGHKIIKVN